MTALVLLAVAIAQVPTPERIERGEAWLTGVSAEALERIPRRKRAR